MLYNLKQHFSCYMITDFYTIVTYRFFIVITDFLVAITDLIIDAMIVSL